MTSYLMTNQKHNLVVFDFEMACKSWFINYISTVLYYANHFPKKISDNDFESNFMNHFWIGYEQEFSIDKFERKWINKFLLYRDLMVYGFVTNLWSESELLPNQLKYLDKIQNSIKIRRKRQGI